MTVADAFTDVSNIVFQARALVFDFDGTLVDSNAIKWRAFEKCFVEFPDRHEEIFKYCQGNNHMTRGEKFRHVYETILKLTYTPTIEADLHEQFAATTSQIIAAPEIQGANQYLQKVSGSHITALLSSTPHDTLLQILEGRGWRHYFATIQGSPVDKEAWLRVFRKKHRLAQPEVLFFGDTPEDASAAQGECTFIAVGECNLASFGLHSISDFTDLLTL